MSRGLHCADLGVDAEELPHSGVVPSLDRDNPCDDVVETRSLDPVAVLFGVPEDTLVETDVGELLVDCVNEALDQSDPHRVGVVARLVLDRNTVSSPNTVSKLSGVTSEESSMSPKFSMAIRALSRERSREKKQISVEMSFSDASCDRALLHF